MVNQQNQRSIGQEKPLDMTPCRVPLSVIHNNPNYVAEGEVIEWPQRWNNPHHSNCEVCIMFIDINNLLFFFISLSFFFFFSLFFSFSALFLPGHLL